MIVLIYLLLITAGKDYLNNPEFVETTPSENNVIIEVTTTTTIITTKVEEIQADTPIQKDQKNKYIEEVNDANIKSTVAFRLTNEQPNPQKCYVIRDASSKEDLTRILSDLNIAFTQTYTYNLKGASFCTNEKDVLEKLGKENIKIEENAVYKISSVQQHVSKHLFLMKNYTNSFFNSYFYDNLVFRILQIDKIFKYFFGSYKYYYTGKNTRIFMIDTSVNVRAPNISNITGNKRSCNSHGDINVDLIMDKTRGFARDTDIVVLDGVDCDGNIRLSEILALLEIVKKENRPTVLLFGVSGPYSQILNDAVDSLSSKGVLVISPAGNNHDNACYHSPSSAKQVLTIGSVNRHTGISNFSNFGSCVRIYSLGQEIYETNQTKGTSHAAATVAGAVAMYLEKHSNASFSDIWSFLDNNSYWNGSYMVFKLPYLSLDYRSQESKSKESSSDAIFGYVLLFCIIVFIIFIIYYLVRKRRRINNRRDYVIDTNLRD